MDKRVRNWLITFGAFFILSVVFTILLLTVDVRASFNNPKLGLASMNEKVFNAIGESKVWYYITQILGYLAILVVICFAVIGVIQLIKGKSIILYCMNDNYLLNNLSKNLGTHNFHIALNHMVLLS